MLRRIPRYCRHKGTGQAYVTIDGRERYLGPYGSPESREEYDGWSSSGDVTTTSRASTRSQSDSCAGPPPDDGVAVHELQRLLCVGAALLVFAWPAFWWLEHYAGFNRFLRANFACVEENRCFIAFDLRKKFQSAGGGPGQRNSTMSVPFC